MGKCTINGVELEFDIFDGETYKKFTEARNEFVEELGKIDNESSDFFIRQCRVIKDFFDRGFGEGTGEKVCGERDNLRSCINAMGEAIKEEERQAAEIKEGNEYYAKIVARSTKPNRQQRRANKK